MKCTIATLIVALAAFVLPGCADGKFNPSTAASVVSDIEAPACTMLGVVTGNHVVGAVCKDVAEIVGAILSKIKPSATHLVGETRYVGVSLNGRAIGVVRADLAPMVQAELDRRVGAK